MLRRIRLKSAFYLSAGVLLALPIPIALPQHAAPRPVENQLVVTVDSSQSAIHWTLVSSLHTVHGTFVLKGGTVQLDPATGKASGEIVADATSGKSGNDGRDKKMHKEVLESGRFSEVIFRPDSVSGKLAPAGDSTLQVHGIFVLHGTEHELTVPVQAHLAGHHWTATASFSVPFIEWGLKNPSNWLIKVQHLVTVDLDLKGAVQTSASH